MEDRNREPFVDDLLDAALARHRSAEPRPGLEQRALARLRAEPQPRPWFGWAWRLAAGVAVFAIVVATAHWARRTALAPEAPPRSTGGLSPETNKASTLVSTLQPEVAKPAMTHTARRTAVRTVRQVVFRRAVAEPRRETFPSPAPLSKEERLLMSYVKLGPPPGSMGSHPGSEEIEEIQIAPLEIAPLKSESAQLENEIN